MFNPSQKRLQQSKIKYRLSDRIFGARLDLILKTAHLFLNVSKSRVCAHADHKPGSGANRVPTDIEAAVEVSHNIDKSDGIHVKHGGGVRIVAHLWRIARDANQVMNSSCRGSQQVGLDSEHVSIPAGVMQNCLSANFALEYEG